MDEKFVQLPILNIMRPSLIQYSQHLDKKAQITKNDTLLASVERKGAKDGVDIQL